MHVGATDCDRVEGDNGFDQWTTDTSLSANMSFGAVMTMIGMMMMVLMMTLTMTLMMKLMLMTMT